MLAVGAGAIALIAGLILIGAPNRDAPLSASEVSPETVDTPSAQPAASDPLLQPAQSGGAPPAPTDLSFRDDSLVFTADLPDASVEDLVVRGLAKEAEAYLSERKASARTEASRLRRAGETPRPWTVSIAWMETARAGGIVSLAAEISEDTGGAHPSLTFASRTGRSGTGETIRVEDMLLPSRSPSPALVIAICEALRTEKMRITGSATIFDEPIVCAGPAANLSLEEATLSLAPSNEPDRFGGMNVDFPPYAVGAWAEGPYRLLVQQAVFADDLRPEYRALFSGMAPAR
jgi:hypothetical protein